MSEGTHAARPLRVLHFVSGGFSGATQVAIDLCAPNARQETMLVLRRRTSVDPSERVAQMRADGMNVVLAPRWPRVAAALQVMHQCRRWKPDVVVAHGFSDHIWGRWGAWLADVPCLIHVEHNVRERYSWLLRRQSLWLAQRTGAIVGVSYAVRDALLREGHPADKCHVIHNGIDLQRFSEGLPWEEREDAIIMPARFASQKDQATLIRAAALLAERGQPVPVYLAGGGKWTWMHRAERLARKLGVQSHVHFLGQVADLPARMARVKLCVLSTHYEGLGLGLIEGMASGCCAIGSDVEGVRECFVDGESGVLVPHADPAALADTVQELLAPGSRAPEIAARGREWAHAHFDRRRMVSEYLDLISKVGGGKASV
ncbi:MAG: glycosyltransferase family 4 protein [Ottowia sp.]|nr:glycosyltransferase family 4 protein [Ottowia sp.]